MKERHKDWIKLSSVPPNKPKSVIITLRTLPGVQQVENDIVSDLRFRRNVHPFTLQKIYKLSQELFGVSEQETKFRFPTAFQSWHPDLDKRQHAINANDRHEGRFKTIGLSDNEAVIILKEMGYDFSTEHGHPMHLVGYLKHQVEAVYMKMAGHPPDTEAAGIQHFGIKMEEEARVFMARKR